VEHRGGAGGGTRRHGRRVRVWGLSGGLTFAVYRGGRGGSGSTSGGWRRGGVARHRVGLEGRPAGRRRSTPSRWEEEADARSSDAAGGRRCGGSRAIGDPFHVYIS
jgi:hypothetical protein